MKTYTVLFTLLVISISTASGQDNQTVDGNLTVNGSLEIKGDLIIHGDLIVRGDIPTDEPATPDDPTEDTELEPDFFAKLWALDPAEQWSFGHPTRYRRSLGRCYS